MNLTARERLLMSLTSKEVEKIMDKMRGEFIVLPYVEHIPINGKETDVIELPLWREIKLDMNDLLDLHMTLQQRDQQVINENKSAITKGYEIERTKE